MSICMGKLPAIGFPLTEFSPWDQFFAQNDIGSPGNLSQRRVRQGVGIEFFRRAAGEALHKAKDFLLSIAVLAAELARPGVYPGADQYRFAADRTEQELR